MLPMDKELDFRVRRVASGGSHPGLQALDVTVLDRITRERVGRARARRLDAISFAGALAIGITSSIAFAGPPASPTSPPIGGLSPLAPSVLLEHPR